MKNTALSGGREKKKKKKDVSFKRLKENRMAAGGYVQAKQTGLNSSFGEIKTRIRLEKHWLPH